MFKEYLKNDIMPFIIEDSKKGIYYDVLNKAQKGNIEPMIIFFKEEQEIYFKSIKDLL